MPYLTILQLLSKNENNAI